MMQRAVTKGPGISEFAWVMWRDAHGDTGRLGQLQSPRCLAEGAAITLKAQNPETEYWLEDAPPLAEEYWPPAGPAQNVVSKTATKTATR
jgi:hypothetical protein